MIRFLRRLRRNSDGTSLIEFAIVGPVVLMAIIGCVEFGRFFWIRNTLEHAVEEAGRYAIINKTATSAQIQTQVRNRVMGVDPSTIVVTVTSAAGTGVTYKTIYATTSSGTVSFVSGFLPVKSMKMEATTRVVVGD
ncbi:MAG: pilus assembly protein [Alphaproteobacteria bacterium]|nr:pilus assembly protein [Alphaproteobacteria bacterium]